MLDNGKRSLLWGLIIILILTIPSFSMNSLSGISNTQASISISLDPSAIHQISTLEDLQNISYDLDGDYELMNDIDASETKNWNNGSGFLPIGNISNPFNGTFDGKGHSITGLYIETGNDNAGLISISTNRSVISNISLIDVNITGYRNVGGIIGLNYGIVNNSYVTGSIMGNSSIGGIAGVSSYSEYHQYEIIECSTDVSVVGSDLIGGIIGNVNGASITGCSSQGYVYCEYPFLGGGGGIAGGGSGSIKECFSNATILGHSCLGGIVGMVRYYNFQIQDCYTDCYIHVTDSSAGGIAGSMGRGSIERCYSISIVESDNYSGGGLVGNSYMAQATDSYWDKEASNVSTSAIGIGKTTEEMMDDFLYRHWDLEKTWDIIDGRSYPFLRWSNLSEVHIEDIQDQYVDEDRPFELELQAVSDLPGGRGANWNFTTDAGEWLRLHDDNIISGTPGNDDVGVHWVNVSATINHFVYDHNNFTLTVNNTNDPPIIVTSALPDAFEDIPYSYFIETEDIDPTGDMIQFIMSSKCDFLSIDKDTGELFGIPDEGEIGQFKINIQIIDGKGGRDEKNLTLRINNTNDDPVILTTSIDDILEDEQIMIQIEGEDHDPTNDRLLWTMETQADFIQIEDRTGIISGIPTNLDVGVWDLMINLSDGNGGSSKKTIILTVINVNDPPVIEPIALSDYPEDEELLIDLEAYDIDPTMDDLTWSLDTGADFLSIDESTGMIRGIPVQEDVGRWSLNVSVSDGNGGFDTCTLIVNISNVNDPPTVVDDSIELIMDEDTVHSIDLTKVFLDEDDDILTYSINETEHLTVSIEDDILVLQPEGNWSGISNLELTAFDGSLSGSTAIIIDVVPVNDAPFDARINSRESFYVNEDHLFFGSANDPDLEYGDRLHFQWISNISGILGNDSSINVSLPSGLHKITLKVWDEAGIETSHSLDISIMDINQGAQENDQDNILGWAIYLLVFILLIIFITGGFLTVKIFLRRRIPSDDDFPKEEDPPMPFRKAPDMDGLLVGENKNSSDLLRYGIVPEDEKK